MSAVPEGFRRIERLSPFNALVGPLYERRDGDAVSIGLRIEDRHTNSRAAPLGVIAGTVPLAVDYAGAARAIVRASAIFARDGKQT